MRFFLLNSEYPLSVFFAGTIRQREVYFNGIEGFWSFAKEHFMKYHGVNPVKFPLCLKELEFRYNNRHHDIYDAVVKCISEYSLGASIQEPPNLLSEVF